MDSPVMTIPEAAEYARTTVWQIRTLIWNGELRHCKLGKRLLVERTDLNRLLSEACSEAQWTGEKAVGQ